jgi:hypothetical protein
MTEPLVLFGALLVIAAAKDATPSVADSPISLASQVSRLRSIEQRVLPPTLAEGPPAHENLLDYFRAANPQLQARLWEAREAFAKPGGEPQRMMTIIAGPAGVGKTFIKGEVYSEIPKQERWKFDVRELFAEFEQDGLAVLKPDLRCGDRVFNRLLSLTDGGRQAFRSHLRLHLAPFVVVDSVDEVHPDDYEFVLKELEHAALDTDRSFIHLVVFGRPLAFRNHWLGCESEGRRPELRGFTLHKPIFRTTGDLAISNWNYDCWKHSLRRTGDGKSCPLACSDYLRWADQRYAASGEFSDVVFTANDHITPEARDLLFRWASEQPIVASLLPNLAANEMVRDSAVAAHKERAEFDERAFMEEFMARWLERDTKSDDRPSRRKPEHLQEYLRLLEAVAAKTLREGRVDQRGYFSVPEDWTIDSPDGRMPVSVIQILNRSGLVSVDPAHPLSQRFRFEPFWFHRLLAQRFLERDVTRIGNAPIARTISPRS